MATPDQQAAVAPRPLRLPARIHGYHWHAEHDTRWPHPGVQWRGYLHTPGGTRIAALTIIDHTTALVLRYLVVAPAYRGQGLGRALLQALLSAYPALPIRLRVAPDDDSPLPADQLAAWYTRHGFVADRARLVRAAALVMAARALASYPSASLPHQTEIPGARKEGLASAAGSQDSRSPHPSLCGCSNIVLAALEPAAHPCPVPSTSGRRPPAAPPDQSQHHQEQNGYHSEEPDCFWWCLQPAPWLCHRPRITRQGDRRPVVGVWILRTNLLLRNAEGRSRPCSAPEMPIERRHQLTGGLVVYTPQAGHHGWRPRIEKRSAQPHNVIPTALRAQLRLAGTEHY